MDARFISGKLHYAGGRRFQPAAAGSPAGAKRRGSTGMIRPSLICGPD